MPLDSAELSQIAAEAQDIAKSAAQPPATHHLLLATFTVPGLSFVYLMSSWTELTGTWGFTTSAICTCVVTVTGLKSVRA